MNSQSNKLSFAFITILFFIWGFITCLNDILIPYMKSEFSLTHFQANLIQFSFFGAYFAGSVIYYFFSIFFGDPINKAGYKNGIIFGLFLSAIACLLFYPATGVFHSFEFCLVALFLLGLGFTILQIAANPYVILLGSPDTAAGRLNLSQAFNSLGTTLAPVIGGYFIFHFFASNQNGTDSLSVKVPYLFLAAVLLLTAILIFFKHLPEFKSQQNAAKSVSIFKGTFVAPGAIAIFAYVGAEVAIGSNLVSLIQLPEIYNLSPKEASGFLSYYWGGAMIGRFSAAISQSGYSSAKKAILMLLSSLICFVLIYSINFPITGISFDKVYVLVFFIILNVVGFIVGGSSPQKTLTFFSFISLVLLLLSIFFSGAMSMWLIISVGLFNSVMWSNIFAISVSNLGERTSKASSVLVMMILGGALIPPVQGLVADNAGVKISFIVPAVMYIYLLYFGVLVLRKKQNTI